LLIIFGCLIADFGWYVDNYSDIFEPGDLII